MSAGGVDIAGNLARVRREIAVASEGTLSAGRVRLVAVTKTVPPGSVAEAYAAGQRLFGENRVQEALEKMHALVSLRDVEWHLIGHLQTNKARQASEAFACIQSVDSVRLARRLDHNARQIGRALPILLEVNVAGEASKSGFDPEELRQILAELQHRTYLDLRGLMTVAPFVQDPEEVRPVFRQLRLLRDELRDRLRSETFSELSMGMSGDFRVAVEEGATLVRIGRAIFGERSR